jgi:hypothetical protein
LSGIRTHDPTNEASTAPECMSYLNKFGSYEVSSFKIKMIHIKRFLLWGYAISRQTVG